jgi:hypothetical protein
MANIIRTDQEPGDLPDTLRLNPSLVDRRLFAAVYDRDRKS